MHKSRESIDAQQAAENKKTTCPECLRPCSQEEFDVFSGLCEECSVTFDEEGEDDSDECCEECGCYNGHHTWCDYYEDDE